MPTTRRDGVELYFSADGSGPAVLFHTGGGGDGRMWPLAGYTAAFPETEQLLMDHRGHGRSSRPRGLEAHRIEEYVADVVAVLDAARVERAALVGYSAGANVVLRVAAEHPERCTAVVAIGGPPHPVEASEGNRLLAAHLREVGMRALMQQFSAGEPEPAPQWLIENLAGTETEMFALQLEAWADAPGLWGVLPKVTAPTLLVVGELEQGEPGAVQAAAAQLADGRAFVSPGCAHLQNFWHTEVTGPVIRGFFQESVRTG
jgi:pimeloyl-ACP methyl ester carboxylesterase